MIPTEHKMRMIEALYRAGVRRMEATAFVSPLAVPQLADAPDILTFAQSLPGLDVQILVPNLRNAERALAAGARHLRSEERRVGKGGVRTGRSRWAPDH